MFLAAVSFIVFALLGGIFSRLFFQMQTDIGEIVDYGTDYLIICTVCSLGIFFQITFERLLQSTGKTFYTMITQGVGAIVNIILDPIMIFGPVSYTHLDRGGAGGHLLGRGAVGGDPVGQTPGVQREADRRAAARQRRAVLKRGPVRALSKAEKRKSPAGKCRQGFGMQAVKPAFPSPLQGYQSRARCQNRQVLPQRCRYWP